MSERQVRVIVRGKVQGVFFRQSTHDEAVRLGVVGTVRNLPDRSVELVARGDPERVAALLEWARHGPPAARVDALEVTDEAVDEALAGFRVLR